MIWWHRPGQKIRVRDGMGNFFHVRIDGEIIPQQGVTYTIRDVVLGSFGIVCFTLVEIINEPREYIDGLLEMNFSASSFYPLSDISDLEKMLVVEELEDA
jgi:hypothetical protein